MSRTGGEAAMDGGAAAAVIVAAGRGARVGGDVPKQFLDLAGRPVLAWSIHAFGAHPEIASIVVVLPAEAARTPPAWIPEDVRVAAGGESRSESVARGLAALDPDVAVVLVHDAARPFVHAGLITRVCEAARAGPAIPVIPVEDTLKRIDAAGRVLDTPDRGGYRRAQTPQGFPARLLKRLHAERDAGERVTDDAMLCERASIDVATVDGSGHNFKITTSADLAYARWLVDTGVIDLPMVE